MSKKACASLAAVLMAVTVGSPDASAQTPASRTASATSARPRCTGRHQIYAGDRPVALPAALKRRLPVVVENVGEPQAKACGTGCGCD